MTTSTSISTPDPRRWWALFLLCAAQFLVILDTSIVGIALPAIQRSLGFDAAGLQWIFNAYVVALGGLLLLGGRLADLFGPRRLFAGGFVVLTVASLIAGLATTPALLIAARAAQGVGAALIAPAALSLLMGLFAARPAELRKALGFWGAAAAAGGTAGVFLGGLITEWSSWRWTFLINVPIGVLVLMAIPRWLPRGARRAGSVDVAGSAAVTSALALAVYAIVTANDPGSTMARTAAELAISAALFAAFVLIQRTRREPLMPLGIFAAPNLAIGNVLMALLGAAWIPLWFFLNMYLQAVLGYGAFASGLALLPMTLTIMVLMVAATERVVGRIGPKAALVLGLAALGVSLALFAGLPVGGTFVGSVLLPSLLGAVGMSLAYIPAMITATAGARAEDGGLASGLVNTTYQVGSAIGLAAMVAVAGSRTADLSRTQDAITALNGGFSAAFGAAAAIAFVAAGLAALAIGARRAGAAPTVAVMLVLGLLAGCTSVRARDEHRGHEPAAGTAPAVGAPASPVAVVIDAVEAPAPAIDAGTASPAAPPVTAPSKPARRPRTPAPAAVSVDAGVDHDAHGHHHH